MLRSTKEKEKNYFPSSIETFPREKANDIGCELTLSSLKWNFFLKMFHRKKKSEKEENFHVERREMQNLFARYLCSLLQ